MDHVPGNAAAHNDTSGKHKKPRMGWDDKRAVVTLLTLYFLQGIPMGLCGAMPMLFQDLNVSDSDQGVFSFASWPFSLKILWAPLIDALFLQSVGRRKSWVVPTQFMIALILYFSSLHIDDLLDAETNGGVQIKLLTGLFFVLFFCCATQDVAVDGWALSMLSPAFVGYASVCNSVGQTLGNYVAYLIHAYDFATLPEAMRFWAYVFLLTTVIVFFFKPEKKPKDDVVEGIGEAYRGMVTILKMKNVQKLLVVLLLVKAPFVVAEGLSSLRLQAHGMPKSAIANIGLVTAPISLILPFLINPGRNVMALFKRNYVPRLLTGLIFPVAVYFSPLQFDDPVPFFYYGIVTLISIAAMVVSMNMFVAQMAYFSRISDNALGGTYMTLLNTFANLGYKLPSSIGFFFVDLTTTHLCLGGTEPGDLDTQKTCESNGGSWEKGIDGYYICCVGFFFAGLVLWFCYIQRTITSLERIPIADWKIPNSAL